MQKTIKNKKTIIEIATVSLALLTSTPTYADDYCDHNAGSALCNDTSGLPSVTPVGEQGNVLVDNVTSIINAVIGVLGLACVIIMIVGGVNYMTSSGDAGKVKKAKDTILYGAIGLIICVLAFAIVNWIIGGLLSQQ